jgi:hypothetical protein
VTGAASAKRLQPMIRNLLRDGLIERGWVPRRGRATILDASGSVVAAPLSGEFEIVAEGAKYGGVRLSARVELRHDESGSLVAAMPAEALPRMSASTPHELVASAYLDSVSSRSLAQTAGHEGSWDRLGSWTVESEAEAEPAVRALLELVDGPLASWLHERRSVTAALDRAAADPAATASRSSPIRSLAVLALLSARPDTARAVIGAGRPVIRDSPERLALFERLLAERFPAYGPLQRS